MLKYLLAGLGTVLICLGVVIQFLDWRRSKTALAKISYLERHADWLRDNASDLAAEPKTRGVVTPEGIDIGEAFEIMEAGLRGARDDTRKQIDELLDAVHDVGDRKLNGMFLSWWLIGIGTAMTGAANFV